MEALKETLAQLPVVATSPMAFVAYVFVIVAVVIVTLKSHNLKTLMANLKDLPEAQRRQTIRDVTNNVVPESITAEEWIRMQRMRYTFGAFTLVCAVVVMFGAMAYAQRRGLTPEEQRAESLRGNITAKHGPFETLRPHLERRLRGDRKPLTEGQVIQRQRIEEDTQSLAQQLASVPDEKLRSGYRFLTHYHVALAHNIAAEVTADAVTRKDESKQAIDAAQSAQAIMKALPSSDWWRAELEQRRYPQLTSYQLAIAQALNAHAMWSLKKNSGATPKQAVGTLRNIPATFIKEFPPREQSFFLEWVLKHHDAANPGGGGGPDRVRTQRAAKPRIGKARSQG